MVQFKPRRSVQKKFEEACKETGGEYSKDEGLNSHRCEYEQDEARGYGKRRVILDGENGEITVGSGGAGATLEDIKNIKTEKPSEMENERSMDITGKPATKTLKIQGTRGQIRVQTQESRFTQR
jgi:succinyl-CoA synthetase beta subunit